MHRRLGNLILATGQISRESSRSSRELIDTLTLTKRTEAVMRELSIVYLALTAIAIAGCTTTSRALYPADPVHFEQIPPDEEFQVDMINGAKLKASSVLVEGDSLHLFAAPGGQPMMTVHRSEVLQLSQSKVDDGRVLLLATGIAILGILTIVITSAVKDYNPWEGEEWCLPPQCQANWVGRKNVSLAVSLSR